MAETIQTDYANRKESRGSLSRVLNRVGFSNILIPKVRVDRISQSSDRPINDAARAYQC